MKTEEKVLGQIKLRYTKNCPEAENVFFLWTSNNCQKEMNANYVFPILLFI